MRATLLNRARCVVVGIASCTGVWAAEPPSQQPAAEVASLKIAVSVDRSTTGMDTRAIAARVTDLMMSAGYAIVQDARAADVRIDVSIQAREEKCFFNVNLNGKYRRCYEGTLSVTAIAARDTAVLIQVRQDFSASGSVDIERTGALTIDVPNKELERALAAVRSSGKLEAFARQLQEWERDRARKEQVAREKKVREEEAARLAEEKRKAEEAQHAERADDDAWAASSPDACRQPHELTACEGVRKYIAEYGAGRHAEQAQTYLKEAEPRLALLVDEANWKGTPVDKCARPTSSTDCEKVEAYISNHPTGTHAAEAMKVLKGASARVASLKKSEQARADAAEAIEQLCQTLQSLEQLEQAEKMQRRIDAASGTVNLYQKRQNATARIYLRDQRQKLMSEIAAAGIHLDRKRDCKTDD